jgi:PAS domain S-box-containing protein
LDELKQKTWVELTYPDDLDADLEKFNQVLENRIDSYSMEKRFIRKNGSMVFTKISVGCVRNSDGSVNYIVLLMEDITDRKIDEIVIRKSEERWQFALEGSGDGVWDWSIQLNEVFFSKQWKAMLGFKEDEISGNLEEWDKIIHPDDIEKVHEDIQKHLDGKTPVYENEHRIQCKDGSYKWIYSRGKVISRTEKGKPLRMIGTHSDITGRKWANEELRKSEDRFRFMAKNTGDVLYRLQYDTMKFEYISPAISVLTGYTAEEINKIGFKSLIDQTVIPGTPDVLSEELRKKRMEGTTGEWRAEYKILSKSGEEKWLGDHSFPWKDDSGKIIGSIGILQNITERKLAELELAKHREHLEELVKEQTGEVERSQKSLVLLMEDVNEVNQELKDVNIMLDATNKELEAFSYSVSHDLRAPLTRMDGFSKVLIDSYSNKLDDQGIHFLNRIRASSQRMAKLIDDLLLLSRITREKNFRQKVDLSKITGKIAEELKASETGRKVNFNIAKGLSTNADRKFVVIILENLLGNAFKFTGKKKNAIIEFDKKTIDNKEVFFIKDNGAGFNMKYYNKIFTAFQRLHSDEEFKGTGIGLAIVQRIINKHGGKIWAESEVGEGTTFYFRFE